ncbi:hypothetical protein CMV_006520 [Castanea mollissima]|nr:hypothetical protein CMV_006520 [Castanea mollissima]
MGTNRIRGIKLCSPERTEVSLKAKIFKRMKNLKFLIGNVHIGEELEYLPDELRFLEWHVFPLSLSSKCCPPEQLVALKMSSILLEKVFKQGFQYKNLKIIELKFYPQSLSRLWNQFGEILGILPNTVAEAESKIYRHYYLTLPAIEIPKWFKFNHHQVIGNSVSFLVGPKFSNLVVFVTFPSKVVNTNMDSLLSVKISINGGKQQTICETFCSYGNVWLVYGKVKISNPSEENRIEVAKIQAMLESDTDCKEETINQPMQGVPKNTTCPTCFDSDSNSGNEAPNPGDGDLPMGFTIRVHLQCPIPFSTMIATPICINHHRTQKHLDPTLKRR